MFPPRQYESHNLINQNTCYNYNHFNSSVNTEEMTSSQNVVEINKMDDASSLSPLAILANVASQQKFIMDEDKGKNIF